MYHSTESWNLVKQLFLSSYYANYHVYYIVCVCLEDYCLVGFDLSFCSQLSFCLVSVNEWNRLV